MGRFTYGVIYALQEKGSYFSDDDLQ